MLSYASNRAGFDHVDRAAGPARKSGNRAVYTIPRDEILAKSSDAALASVVLEAAPLAKLYASPAFGVQATGNSDPIRAFWLPLRKAAAGARELLVKAASQTGMSILRA